MLQLKGFNGCFWLLASLTNHFLACSRISVILFFVFSLRSLLGIVLRIAWNSTFDRNTSECISHEVRNTSKGKNSISNTRVPSSFSRVKSDWLRLSDRYRFSNRQLQGKGKMKHKFQAGSINAWFNNDEIEKTKKRDKNFPFFIMMYVVANHEKLSVLLSSLIGSCDDHFVLAHFTWYKGVWSLHAPLYRRFKLVQENYLASPHAQGTWLAPSCLVKRNSCKIHEWMRVYQVPPPFNDILQSRQCNQTTKIIRFKSRNFRSNEYSLLFSAKEYQKEKETFFLLS